MGHNKISSLKVFYFVICVSMAFILYLVLHVKPEITKETKGNKVVENQFTASNYNVINVDTFGHIVNAVYKDIAKLNRTEDKLILKLNVANQKAFNFYNGNTALLNYKLNDFGFEIGLNEQGKYLLATFVIYEQGIQVPNDLMINLTKLYTDLNK